MQYICIAFQWTTIPTVDFMQHLQIEWQRLKQPSI